MKLGWDDSIEQLLIKLREKIAQLAPSLKFQCFVKIADIIKGNVECHITFDYELTYNNALDLLKKWVSSSSNRRSIGTTDLV
ncbi:hypothetical protein A1C_01595 [Rickettsia akari str. Hartford]|uniref:Uncharacterized protein n=1 Tax=Rickettsia akari (strain Hartford) TaxID=293614 RepID=A8GMK5_RICAH|nr:hypothetical protein A1C_01595 [Rickettsia akari str. Hartford]